MLWWCIEKCIRNSIRVQTLIPWPTLKKTAEFSEERCLDLPFFTVFSQKWPFKESNHFSILLVELNELANCDRTSCEGSRWFTFFVLIVSTRTAGVMRTALQLMFWVNGKIVLSVGGARRKSFYCPRLVLGLSSFVLFVVFTMSLCCAVSLSLSPMSQAYPQVLTYSLGCLCQELFQTEGFGKDLQRKSERPNTFLNVSFSSIADGKIESQHPVLCKYIFTIY